MAGSRPFSLRDGHPCGCEWCRALLRETGTALFPYYSRRLLRRGWAGALSDAERQYLRAHCSWYRAQEARGHALQGAGFTLSSRGEQPQDVPEPTDGDLGVLDKLASAW